ncbi:CLUMA_CG005818, isoform A [Clunio marinus]|uniref:CLUMA_CG005818, isoform A n=1 Tax=Clunio marinus TaxID=568069 RepID=A0A1J1HXL6_9DIPT|nr:CLUMA_CG005818, isoform A [Clunio marinus]
MVMKLKLIRQQDEKFEHIQHGQKLSTETTEKADDVAHAQKKTEEVHQKVHIVWKVFVRGDPVGSVRISPIVEPAHLGARETTILVESEPLTDAVASIIIKQNGRRFNDFFLTEVKSSIDLLK